MRSSLPVAFGPTLCPDRLTLRGRVKAGTESVGSGSDRHIHGRCLCIVALG